MLDILNAIWDNHFYLVVIIAVLGVAVLMFIKFIFSEKKIMTDSIIKLSAKLIVLIALMTLFLVFTFRWMYLFWRIYTGAV